ncbi:dipeptide epimerase [Clostridium estertheticum]|uniref:dipeptide epimerase n=1 Tax=Clostridium estertheticum TaxID=238834 RepID=UPI001C0DF289|nr:dipeptide epimerase [Clostridium estertheticum]MBU3213649.1 dipeptide epimerase [Clostridium estertheticum]WAG53540.1 dipeptide epimerase [Clostridium estertheticum]
MKIQDIKMGRISTPLKHGYKVGKRMLTFSDEIVIKMITDTGEVGYGSAAPTPLITGETDNSIIGAINYIKPEIIGLDIENIEEIMKVLHNSIHGNNSAKAAIDIAIYDLLCKKYGIPLYKFLGGYKTSLTTDLTIVNDTVEQMVGKSLKAVMDGYTCLKVKVGNHVDFDIEKVKSVRKAVRRGIKIRVDANQGWRPKEAVSIIRKFEDMGLDIEFVEQPVNAWDIDGLKYVTDNVSTKILADEAVFGPSDAFKIIEKRAADLISIKLMKCGGINNAIKIYNMAENMGIRCMMGCMLENRIGITAAASFAASKSNLVKADLDTMLYFDKCAIVGGAAVEGNTITINDSPGLGISDIIGWNEIS